MTILQPHNIFPIWEGGGDVEFIKPVTTHQVVDLLLTKV